AEVPDPQRPQQRPEQRQRRDHDRPVEKPLKIRPRQECRQPRIAQMPRRRLRAPEEWRRQQRPDQYGGGEIEEDLPERFQGLNPLMATRPSCRSISPRFSLPLSPNAQRTYLEGNHPRR